MPISFALAMLITLIYSVFSIIVIFYVIPKKSISKSAAWYITFTGIVIFLWDAIEVLFLIMEYKR
jgi:hypothetical protein